MPGMDMEGMEDEYMYEMMMEEEYGMEMMGEFGLPGAFGAQAAEEKESGFVVTLVCYSPYGDNVAELGTLVDPHGVDDQPDKWGFVTRLAHLDDYVEDGNSPFELYEKGVPEQFGLEIKKVNVDEEMPGGIGVQEVRYNTADGLPKPGDPGHWVLVDPLTKEIMNEVSVLDEKGEPVHYGGKEVKEVNDHWFVLNVKFIWRDAPEAPEQPGAGMFPGMGMGMPMR
ncbi:MAG: hypothetical protein ACYTBS_05430 [Planctomycetota bacterium]|jgi:hypothetical protein